MIANRRSRGFTLLEAITVIVITGVIATAVAVFMQKPVQGYFGSTARTALTDTADTALRRIARDVRLALPNTVRVDPSGLFLEFIPIKTGGRYLDKDACFVSPGCTSLSTMGDMLSNVQIVTGSDQVSIYSQYNNSPSNCALSSSGLYSAYCGSGVVTLASATGAGTSSNTLGFAGTVFVPPGGSPTRRIFIISPSPVTYACDAATGTLWRISGYARQAAQPTSLAAAPLAGGPPPGGGGAAVTRAAPPAAAPLAGATSTVALATDVTCPAIAAGSPPRFSYAGGASERYSLLSAWITLTKSGETISLLHQIHVDNTP
jgi:MSHA biogenesis protein MshO